MVKHFLVKLLLRGTENTIKRFVHNFSQGNVVQNGIVIANAAILHHDLLNVVPEFKTLVNSKSGENISNISVFTVFKLDRMQKQLLQKHEIELAAAIKFWSTTFRCMLNESLHQYGVEIWKIAENSFENAIEYLHDELNIAIETGSESHSKRLRGAIQVCKFIPPQFKQEKISCEEPPKQEVNDDLVTSFESALNRCLLYYEACKMFTINSKHSIEKAELAFILHLLGAIDCSSQRHDLSDVEFGELAITFFQSIGIDKVFSIFMVQFFLKMDHFPLAKKCVVQGGQDFNKWLNGNTMIPLKILSTIEDYCIDPDFPSSFGHLYLKFEKLCSE